jgi:hypothetical protein
VKQWLVHARQEGRGSGAHQSCEGAAEGSEQVEKTCPSVAGRLRGVEWPSEM